MKIDRRALVTGTQVNYYHVCRTKLWLFSHGIRMERESELVASGKMAQDSAFPGRRKDIIVDERISIDFIATAGGPVLHEIKKSRRFEEAARAQLLYYIYYMKNVKGLGVRKGIIHYVSSRKVEEVELTEDAEREVEAELREIAEIVKASRPPHPERKGFCSRCAYRDLCWS